MTRLHRACYALHMYRALLLLALLAPAISYGAPDYTDTWKIYDYSGGTSNSVFGNVSYRLGVVDSAYTAPEPVYIATTTLRIYKTGSPTDNVQGIIVTTCNPLTIVATSTNVVAGSSIGTSAGDKTFTFPEYYVASGTSVRIGIRRTGAEDASNYYRVQRNASGSWNYAGNCTEGISGEVNGQMWVYGELAASASSSTCYTDADMATLTVAVASSTEAIIWAGIFNQVMLAIFLFILVAMGAYAFTKPYFSIR